MPLPDGFMLQGVKSGCVFWFYSIYLSCRPLKYAHTHTHRQVCLCCSSFALNSWLPPRTPAELTEAQRAGQQPSRVFISPTTGPTWTRRAAEPVFPPLANQQEGKIVWEVKQPTISYILLLGEASLSQANKRYDWLEAKQMPSVLKLLVSKVSIVHQNKWIQYLSEDGLEVALLDHAQCCSLHMLSSTWTKVTLLTRGCLRRAAQEHYCHRVAVCLYCRLQLPFLWKSEKVKSFTLVSSAGHTLVCSSGDSIL